MADASKHTKLFGGGITANMPTGFVDVSSIRQVPDTQEIYLSTTGLTSLIIDLAERVTEPTDLAALKFHFDDIVNEGDTSNILDVKELQLAKFPTGTPALVLHATTTTTASSRPANNNGTTTILLTLIRLVPQETDVVVTINIPNLDGQGDSEAEGGERVRKLVEEGKRVNDEVVQSLCVQDWGLFGPGGEG